MLDLFKQSLPYLTVLGSVGAFCFAVFKYLHTQHINAKNKRFEQFNKIFEWVAGRTADGQTLVDTQQAMAVYQLSEFYEYRDMSLPIIEYYLAQTVQESDSSLFRASLLYSKAKLSENV
ncbi:hypothetical protein [Neptuniibacter sp. QD34_54]|uniref:hypothetical protein n=1 Tax=Neptuniibacter sp. QD34_54 TaxID=3398208 RepID=UPI0039F54B0A